MRGPVRCRRRERRWAGSGWLDQFPCLFRAFDHGHQQGLHADIEYLLDQCCIADDRANHRMAGVGRHGLELAEHTAQVVGRMFAIDQQPVETGVGGQFCAVWHRLSPTKGRSGPHRCAGVGLKVLIGMSIERILLLNEAAGNRSRSMS